MNAPGKNERKLLTGTPAPLPKDGRKDVAKNLCELKFMEEIHFRAETITPLLKEILERPRAY